jgi:hypothetical protein
MQAGSLHAEAAGSQWVLTGIAHHFGNEGVQKVSDAISQARAANVPWVTIFTTLLPLILNLFTGGKIDLNTIIQAILSLIHPVTP